MEPSETLANYYTQASGPNLAIILRLATYIAIPSLELLNNLNLN